MSTESPNIGTETQRFYDRISPIYDLIADSGERAAREQGIRSLEIEEGERVLEVGYGTGHALVTLAEAVGDEGAVVGLELSEGMRWVAARRLRRAGLLGRARLNRGDARHMPYRDACFDAVFMSFMLELFDEGDVRRVLAESRRVLRPRGRLVVVALSASLDRCRAEDIYQWTHRHFPRIVDCRPIPLEGELIATGFRIVRRAELSIWGLSVEAVVAKPPCREGSVEH